MTQFILNNKTIKTNVSSGMTLLDFIRNNQYLKGTKTGCREGDCGACSILVGTLKDDEMVYQSMTSCLMPLANAAGKHIVTVEGINPTQNPKLETQKSNLTPVQAAMHEEGATQCGFCTVGFVMSMTGVSLEKKAIEYEDVIESIDGNICRCTGYKSIERAAEKLTNLLKTRDLHGSALDFAIKNNIVPSYFADIKNRILSISTELITQLPNNEITSLIVGGGTDLYVQKHADMPHLNANFLLETQNLKPETQNTEGVILKDDFFEISGSATVSDMKHSSQLNGAFPFLQKHLKLVSSTPIRNMATIAGNLVNASPIGDMTVWFLALDATITLTDLKTFEKLSNLNTREIYLKDFYKGYKILDKKEGEILTKIRFKQPEASSKLASGSDYHFNFEKVCKRTYLDIASVNTAIFLETKKDKIIAVNVSMGGVSPIPLFLVKTSEFLVGKTIIQGEKVDWIEEANSILQTEISPISDVRGSAEYKRLLAKQLFKAHFVELFSIKF
jgi:xanthine dehydrogenase small subunit